MLWLDHHHWTPDTSICAPIFSSVCPSAYCASLVLSDDFSHSSGIPLSHSDAILHSQLVKPRQRCQAPPSMSSALAKLSEGINDVHTIHRLAIIYGGQTSQSISSLSAPDTRMTRYKNQGDTAKSFTSARTPGTACAPIKSELFWTCSLSHSAHRHGYSSVIPAR